MWNKLKKVLALFIAATLVSPALGIAGTRSIHAPVHPAWHGALRTIYGVTDAHLQDQVTRWQLSPLVTGLKEHVTSPSAYPTHPEWKDALRAAASISATQALETEAKSLVSQARDLPGGDKNLPGVVAKLYKMGTAWQDNLSPEILEAVHEAYAAAHGKSSERQLKDATRKVRAISRHLAASWADDEEAPVQGALSESARTSVAPSSPDFDLFQTLTLGEKFKAMTFLQAMMAEGGIKAALDADTAHDFAVADKNAVLEAAGKFAPEVYRKVLRIFKDGEEGLSRLVDALAGRTVNAGNIAAAIRVELKAQDLLARPDMLALNAVQLAPFLSIASGAGTLVHLAPRNSYINIGYKPGNPLDKAIYEEHVKSGRSFGIGPTHMALDASDVYYLTTLGQSLLDTDDPGSFYQALMQVLTQSDSSSHANLSEQEQTVLTDFVAIYTAELDRHLMTGLKTHSWEYDLLEATLVSAYAAPARTIWKNGALSEGSPRDFFGMNEKTRRSGIGIMRRDRRTLQRMVCAAARKLYPDEVAAVENIIGQPKDGDLFHALAIYLDNSKNGEAVLAKAGELSRAVAILMSRIHRDAESITRAMSSPE